MMMMVVMMVMMMMLMMVSVDWAWPSITFTSAAVCCVATTTVLGRVAVRNLVGSRARVTDGGPDQYTSPLTSPLFNTPLFRDPALQISRPTYLREVGRPCRITGHPIEVGACGWVHAGRAGEVAEVSHVPPVRCGPCTGTGGVRRPRCT